jgi:hypothetical protein
MPSSSPTAATAAANPSRQIHSRLAITGTQASYDQTIGPSPRKPAATLQPGTRSGVEVYFAAADTYPSRRLL